SYSVGSKVIILEENDPFKPAVSSRPNRMDEGALAESSVKQLVIDKVAYSVYLDDNSISFPKKEFELLLLLASNPKKVFKREDILLTIWGKGYKPKDSRSLDVHIRMLRKKLGEAFISTVRGVGYKLDK
ncbi:MAG TPA: winged helix-turn-helix domain-containing protein, partial [Bacteroidia bacterium]|nr:winged helix-turn-helix domain-containing protein [Bacteroidia bacterium]